MIEDRSNQPITIEIPLDETETQEAPKTIPQNSGDGVEFYVSDGENTYSMDDMPEEQTEAPEPKAKGRSKRKSSTIEEKIKSLEMALQAESQRNQTLYEQYVKKETTQASLQRQIQELNEKLAASAQAQDKQIAINVKNEENKIKHALLQAKNNGDYEAELNYTEQLAELKAKKHAYEAYKYSIEDQNNRIKETEPYVPNIEPIIAPPRRTPSNSHFSDWVQENPWYQNDRMLSSEADEIALELQKRLNLENSSHLIGTYEFFDTVGQILKSKYNVPEAPAQEVQQDQYEEVIEDQAYNVAPPPAYPQQQFQPVRPAQPQYVAPTPPPPTRYGVAPVSQSPSMAQAYAQNSGNQYKNKVTLTPEQRRMAHLLPSRDGNDTLLDKEIRFARGLQMTAPTNSRNPFIKASPDSLIFE